MCARVSVLRKTVGSDVWEDTVVDLESILAAVGLERDHAGSPVGAAVFRTVDRSLTLSVVCGDAPSGYDGTYPTIRVRLVASTRAVGVASREADATYLPTWDRAYGFDILARDFELEFSADDALGGGGPSSQQRQTPVRVAAVTTWVSPLEWDDVRRAVPMILRSAGFTVRSGVSFEGPYVEACSDVTLIIRPWRDGWVNDRRLFLDACIEVSRVGQLNLSVARSTIGPTGLQCPTQVEDRSVAITSPSGCWALHLRE